MKDDRLLVEAAGITEAPIDSISPDCTPSRGERFVVAAVGGSGTATVGSKIAPVGGGGAPVGSGAAPVGGRTVPVGGTVAAGDSRNGLRCLTGMKPRISMHNQLTVNQ